MLTKRGSIFIAAIGTLFCFLSISYVSCTKVGSSPTCNGVICENGGYCNNGFCVCPVGYEGVNCGTASVAKYINTWDVTSIVSGSDSVQHIGRKAYYTMSLQNSATPTAFFINDFLGNANYNGVLCVLDSANSNGFTIDTTSFNPGILAAALHIEPGSGGTFVPASNQIDATIIVMYVTPYITWEIDTLSLIMSPHKI